MPSRMRRPEEVRLPFNVDDWLIVKKHLTTGEGRQVFARMIKRQVAGQRAEIDPTMSGISLIAEYLLDWSILDADGNPVVIRNSSIDVKLAALNELPPEVYNAIDEAVSAHVQAMDAAVEAEKNGQAGATASSAISVSVA